VTAPGLAVAKRWGYKGALIYTAALMAAAVGLGGDDPDDPIDWWAEFEQGMAEWFGKTGGAAVSRGLVNAVGGIDLSSRVSMGDLWWRELDAEVEDRGFGKELVTSLAGPSIGSLVNALEGVALAADGHVYRGIERMVPKALRDPMQAARYFDEGVLSLKGDPLIEELTPFELAMQAGGFKPSRLTARYAENRAEKARETKIEDRRQRLTRDLVDAAISAQNGADPAAESRYAEAMARAQRYSEKQPGFPITAQSVMQSARGRLRARALAKDGVFLNRKIPERYDWAED
jgi:hypothetical protein